MAHIIRLIFKTNSLQTDLGRFLRLVATVDKDIDIESQRNHYQQKPHWQAII